MSVKRRPNGKWRARYRDEAGREHARHFDTQREARAWEAHRRSLVARGEHLASPLSALTLAEYATRHYLPSRAWAASTIRGFRVILDQVPFREKPLQRITRADGERWVAEMARTSKTSTVRTRFAKVRALLTAAVENRVLSHNPLAGIALPSSPSSAVPRDDLPTQAQVASMYAAAQTVTERALVGVMASAGLRMGEVLGLQAGDVDVQGRVLRVRRQAQKWAGVALEVKAPKYGSIRDVPVPEHLVQDLAAQIALVDAAGPDWVFPGGVRGEPLTPSGAAGKIRLLSARAGAHAHPHSLRHFYASALIAHGLGVVEVARLMGHRNISTTWNVYAHLWHDSEEQARSAVAAVGSGIYSGAD